MWFGSFVYVTFLVGLKIAKNVSRVKERIESGAEFFLNMDQVAITVMMIKFGALILVLVLAMLCTCCLICAMRRYHYFEYKKAKCLNLCFMLAMMISVCSSCYYILLAYDMGKAFEA